MSPVTLTVAPKPTIQWYLRLLFAKLSDFKILLPLFARLFFTDEAPYVAVIVPYFV